MAGQLVADWTYCPRLLANPTDLYTWAPLGLGSSRGLNRLAGRPLTAAWAEPKVLNHLRTIHRYLIADLGPEFEDLTLMEVQNCLCEFDKYERTRLREGRPRAEYRPEGRF